MKLAEALEVLRRPLPEDAGSFTVALASGFTPLHLETLLRAELRQALPGSEIRVSTGLFDDLAGNLQRVAAGTFDAVAVVMEWPDLDPRLGLRRLGGWGTDDLLDVVASTPERLDLFGQLLRLVASEIPVVCCLPTLPLPPLFLQRRDESGMSELRLRSLVAAFVADLSVEPGIQIVSAQALDQRSAVGGRRDARSELSSGFPYSLSHAAAVAALVASLICSSTPKKGLITDLDGTLWAGSVGEVGPSAVSWTTEEHAQQHGLYQQFLAALASSGVLIGVASKNDPMVVEQALSRDDLVLPRKAVFPIVVGWGPKSDSVDEILGQWNIAPDDVVFVDDSPMELAEVKGRFPSIECLPFPRHDDEVLELLGSLRDLFGKRELSAEDALRLPSIRSADQVRTRSKGPPELLDDFLRDAGGTVAFSVGSGRDQRALDLINKTNQFNLNGRRLSETAFRRAIAEPSAYLVNVSYEDKYGPLGKIAAVLGHAAQDCLVVDTWVMSCRAFSRRIEYHTLVYLFDKFEAEQMLLSYTETAKNGPFAEFLMPLAEDSLPSSEVRLTRDGLEGCRRLLVHAVAESSP